MSKPINVVLKNSIKQLKSYIKILKRQCLWLGFEQYCGGK
ncbi:24479_t:CDS:2 [Dentiscutata erythropus]|uniref:24479_t:CDS:1 n=1 Tax=Dentiscutata erythropus TaxID=1348616 RepID=A0A9N9G1H5_9GLOM|nr:24479_t:CDS:2 [Dentiscutata erythropus]